MRWRWIAVVLAVTLVALLVPRADAAEGKRYALLIGVDFYMSTDIGTLEFADDDVDDLAKELRKIGFDRVIPFNGPTANRANVVGTLYKLAATIQENDTFLLYFAGHGMRSTLGRRPTYWLTYNAAVAQLDVEGIRLNHLLDYVADIPARKKLIILDHCFSADVIVAGDEGTDPAAPAPIARTPQIVARPVDVTARGGTPIERFEETIRGAGGTIGIAAARGFAYELPDLKHGVLTAALLESLQGSKADTNKDGSLSAIELTTYLGLRVEELSNRKQDAQIWTANGVQLDKWIIAEKLPLDKVEDVTLAANRYKVLFDDWLSRTSVTGFTGADYSAAKRMLEIWIASAGTGRPLTPDEASEIANLRALVEDKNLDVVDRVRALKRVIQGFFGGQ